MAFTSSLNEAITFSDPDVDGKVHFSAPGGDLDLQFTWEALAKLQTQWGDEFLSKAAKGMDELVIEDLQVVVAAASGKKEREIRELGLPILPLSDACKLAWSHAWNGGEPVEARETTPEKKPARLTLFGWRLRAPFERG